MNGQLPAELKFKENTDHFPRPPLDLPFTFEPSILEAQGANVTVKGKTYLNAYPLDKQKR